MLPLKFHRATTLKIKVQAVEELSEVLRRLLCMNTACLSQSELKLLETTLSQRASIYEHLEAYDESLQDFCQLLTLQPSHLLVRWDQQTDAMLLVLLQSCGAVQLELYRSI